MFEGSCCCGEVRFAVSEKPRFVAACHCSRCRKVGATPFAMVAAETFELRSGAERIVRYQPEPPFEYVRCFCGRCGTSLGEIGSDEKLFPVPVDCFDQDLGVNMEEDVLVL